LAIARANGLFHQANRSAVTAVQAWKLRVFLLVLGVQDGFLSLHFFDQGSASVNLATRHRGYQANRSAPAGNRP